MADETAGPNAAKTSADTPSKPRAMDVEDPRELLDSANNAAGQARNAWMAFLGFLAYLIVAVGSVTHSDLLLDSPLRLPFVNVEIPLTGFFVLAPFLLVLVHLSLLVQHAMLAHKYRHFTNAIAGSEGNAARSHPDRRLVHSYVFAQLLAGQRPSIMLEVLMRLMVWTTLGVLPILTLLYFQVTFLPYHDVVVTHLQRFALALDIVLLIALPPLFGFPSLFRRRSMATAEWGAEPGRRRWLPRVNPAGIEWGPREWPWRLRWHHLAAGTIATVIVASFSLFLATVPNAPLDDLISAQVGEPTLEQSPASLASVDSSFASASEGSRTEGEPCTDPDDPEAFHFDRDNLLYCLRTFLFDGDPDPVASTPGGLFGFGRRIVFTDANARQAGLAAGATLSLRGRRLQEAHLDGAPLQGADLIKADLTGTSLRFAKLRGARFCPSFEETSEEISTSKESLCATLKDADLEGASLVDVHLVGADLSGATLANADLQGATIHDVLLRGADLRYSNLERAVLTNLELQTLNLEAATLRSAYLANVRLSEAYLSTADFQDAIVSDDVDLQGACLYSANLQRAQLSGVDLRNADLPGANARDANLRDAKLSGANLRGADLRGADLTGADLRNAIIVEADLEGAIGVNRQGAILTDPATALPIEECPAS